MMISVKTRRSKLDYYFGNMAIFFATKHGCIFFLDNNFKIITEKKALCIIKDERREDTPFVYWQDRNSGRINRTQFETNTSKHKGKSSCTNVSIFFHRKQKRKNKKSKNKNNIKKFNALL
jgi:hypothetical protein